MSIAFGRLRSDGVLERDDFILFLAASLFHRFASCDSTDVVSKAKDRKTT